MRGGMSVIINTRIGNERRNVGDKTFGYAFCTGTPNTTNQKKASIFTVMCSNWTILEYECTTRTRTFNGRNAWFVYYFNKY